MATVKVITGDLDEGAWQISSSSGSVTLHRASTRASRWNGETVNLSRDLESVEQLTEESVKKYADAAALGAIGLLVLGPLGAIGGLLLAGNRKEVAFAATLKDGRRFMASTDGETWLKIYAITFR